MADAGSAFGGSRRAAGALSLRACRRTRLGGQPRGPRSRRGHAADGSAHQACPDRHPHGGPDSRSHPEADAEADAHGYPDPHPQTEADAEADAHGYPDPHPQTEADAHGGADPGSVADADGGRNELTGIDLVADTSSSSHGRQVRAGLAGRHGWARHGCALHRRVARSPGRDRVADPGARRRGRSARRPGWSRPVVRPCCYRHRDHGDRAARPPPLGGTPPPLPALLAADPAGVACSGCTGSARPGPAGRRLAADGPRVPAVRLVRVDGEALAGSAARAIARPGVDRPRLSVAGPARIPPPPRTGSRAAGGAGSRAGARPRRRRRARSRCRWRRHARSGRSGGRSPPASSGARS